MNKKIIFFDIDGTLYDPVLGVTDLTKQAIKELLEKGHIPVICTGRTKAMVPDYLTDMGFLGVLAGAGTYVEYDGKVIHNKTMGPETGDSTIALLKEAGIHYILEGPENIYVDGENNAEEYQRVIQFAKKFAGDRLRTIQEGDYIINKFTCAPGVTGSLEKAEKKLREEYHFTLHIDGNFEMTPKGYDKSTGIRLLLEYLKADRKDTYAFGDSTNDLEMLQYVEYGIAMGNSYPQVLEAARYKTLTIQEDGIYYGLKEFGLI